MCITVSRRGKCFWMVGHVQQSVSTVRRMAKCTLKEFDKVSEVSNTLLNRILGMVVSQNSHAVFLLHKSLLLSLILIDLAADFTE